jgi:hypothetical protein
MSLFNSWKEFINKNRTNVHFFFKLEERLNDVESRREQKHE